MHIIRFSVPLFVTASLMLLSCADKNSENENDIAGTKDGYIAFTDNGSSNYTIVGPSSLKNNLTLFSEAIKKATGAELPVATATTSNSKDLEIIVGNTAARAEAAEALKGIRSGYGILVSGKKLVIAGTDETWTVLAMEAFAKNIMKNAAYCHDGILELPNDYWDSDKDDDPQFIARFIKENRSFTILPSSIGSVPQSGIYKVAQGAASDGTYVYFVMKGNEDASYNSQCVVYKYRLSPFEKISVSAEFNGHHANDMTFDTKNNRALVVNGSGAAGTLTAIDAETMAVSTINTSLGIGGLTYNAKQNIYGVTQGGTKYQIADENFTLKKDYGRNDGQVNSYTAQGMGSDDSFVYFPMSPKSSAKTTDNILCTYDWNGNYVTDIHIPLSLESESMFYADGKYYVNFYNAGARLYKITPLITFKY